MKINVKKGGGGISGTNRHDRSSRSPSSPASEIVRGNTLEAIRQDMTTMKNEMEGKGAKLREDVTKGEVMNEGLSKKVEELTVKVQGIVLPRGYGEFEIDGAGGP